MSTASEDFIVIFPKTKANVVLEKVEKINSNLNWSFSSNNETYWLEEPESFESQLSGEYRINSDSDLESFLSMLKKHNSGGVISVKSNEYDVSVLMSLVSIDDLFLSALIFYVDSNLYDFHENIIVQLILELCNELEYSTLLKGSELQDDWDEEPLIEAVHNGELEPYQKFIWHPKAD
ncbi:MAG: hypothetical protein Crog4KO_05920 [Crocinitomicaceae bacterium]